MSFSLTSPKSDFISSYDTFLPGPDFSLMPAPYLHQILFCEGIGSEEAPKVGAILLRMPIFYPVNWSQKGELDNLHA